MEKTKEPKMEQPRNSPEIDLVEFKRNLGVFYGREIRRRPYLARFAEILRENVFSRKLTLPVLFLDTYISLHEYQREMSNRGQETINAVRELNQGILSLLAKTLPVEIAEEFVGFSRERGLYFGS